MKWLLRVLAVVGIGIAAFWVLGPYENVTLTPTVTPGDIGDNLDAHFAAAEARFDDITPGVQKRIIWAGETGAQTDWVVVYIHGFSATSEEIRPVPDRVAEALGANLIFTRLAGHGRSGAAMAEPSAQDWMNDVAEALFAARRIGTKVLILSTSTGGTLTAAAAQHPELMAQVEGAVFVSPNFGVNSPFAPLLTWPAAREWMPLLVGQTRSFDPANDGQKTYWTTQYPSVAVLPMAALVKEVVGLPHEAARIPALFYFSMNDQVVVPARTLAVASRWGQESGATARVVHPDLGAGDDPFAHVIAGDILSPNQTGAAVQVILNWVESL